MATLTIRDLDEELKQRLRVRAAVHGRSMEEEVRQILRATLEQAPERGADWVQRLRAPFVALGGVELELPPRQPVRDPPDFSGDEYAAYDQPARQRPPRPTDRPKAGAKAGAKGLAKASVRAR